MKDMKPIPAPDMTAGLLGDIRQLIEGARQQAVLAVNAELTLLYWRIGHRIHTQIMGGQRAAYGQEILPTLSAELVPRYGKGFSTRSLTRMVQFAESFPEEADIQRLAGLISWSHFQELLPLKQSLQRDFYAEMCRMERWSVRTLRQRIDSMLYERTALSLKPDDLISPELAVLRESDRVSPDLLMRDPYVLDFLGLHDTYLESDLEAAIVREIESFLLELGAGFSFVARQKRIQLDGEDFYLDLLFFNRKLRRLVAVELKLGEFKASYKGQMELYLRWLDKFAREENELPPLGIILCAGKKAEQIELLELDKSGIHVAEYLTVLPDRAVLAERLHLAARRARQQLEQREQAG